MSKRTIWIPIVLWLVTLAAFVGVAVLFIDKIDTVSAAAVESRETVRYFGPHFHSPFNWILMVFLGFLFMGFIMRLLFRPFLFFGPWGYHRHKHFGYRRRPPWWDETEDEPGVDTRDESKE